MSCGVCDAGWIEIDDMPHPCKRCRTTAEPIQDYVNRIAQAMGLRHWVIEVQASPADEDNLAEVDCVYGQNHARLFVCEKWHTLAPEVQRSTLAHEMMHVHASMWTQMASDTLDPVLKGSKRKIVEAALHLCEEYMVDAVALAWAPALPLPRSVQGEAP